MKFPNKIRMANLPTPVEEIKFNGKRFLVKRDDYTGMETSGNKIRKLEYILAEALKCKADVVITCGGEQSNHARATAVACARLGLKCELFLWGYDKTGSDGNLFFDKLLNCEIRFLNKSDYLKVNHFMFNERNSLKKKGINAYVIPEGGSTTLGILGYVDFISELAKQINLNEIDGIITAAGSGGTAAGLLLGTALRNYNLRIYAVNVLYSEQLIKNRIMQIAEGCNLEFNLKAKIDADRLIILDGFSKEGYKNISENKLKLIKDLFNQTGILLDPAYTGKAFAAFNSIMLSKANKQKILFLHTGGLYGVFAKRNKYLTA